MKNRYPPSSLSSIIRDLFFIPCLCFRCTMRPCNSSGSSLCTLTGFLSHWIRRGNSKPLVLIYSSLTVPCDVSCNPITEFFGVYVGKLRNHYFVMVKIISEFISVLINEVNCTYFYETRSNISHFYHSSNNLTSIGISGSSCLIT